MCHIAFSQNTFGQRAFVIVQANDVFFYCALGDQPIDGDRTKLPDAVCATHCLILGGGVPPRVGDDHVVGCGQIEAESACFEADQE